MKVKPKTAATEKVSLFDKLGVEYKKILVKVLDFPKVFLLVIVAAFVGSLLLFPQLPFIFMPDSDRNLVVVNVDLSLGSKIEETEKVVDQISDFITDNLLVADESEQTEMG